MLDPQSLDKRLGESATMTSADVGHDSGERRVGLAERCARPKTLRARSRARGARGSVFLMFEMFCPSGPENPTLRQWLKTEHRSQLMALCRQISSGVKVADTPRLGLLFCLSEGAQPL